MTVAERVKGRRRAGVLQPPSPEEANWFPLGGGGAAMPGPVADENQANGGIRMAAPFQKTRHDQNNQTKPLPPAGPMN
jgi:hypothetical protein